MKLWRMVGVLDLNDSEDSSTTLGSADTSSQKVLFSAAAAAAAAAQKVSDVRQQLCLAPSPSAALV